MKKVIWAFVAAIALVLFWRVAVALVILCLIAGIFLGLGKIIWVLTGSIQKMAHWSDETSDKNAYLATKQINDKQAPDCPKTWAEYEDQLEALQQAAERLRETGRMLHTAPSSTK